ncbi:class I SAM-dependent methyltransferase [Acaryochloris marina]|nr:class I SAM-dependent methyltransferase [Acaryochloris marina]BDM81691.1 hypothetical protein AM10699_45580 [Acaryochloris marina MBIC10699]
MTNNVEQVRNYYNEFRDTRMLSYRLYGNPRIDKAVELIGQYTRPDSKVLDIGCGIGLVSEKIGAKIKTGHVWACDIADQNIAYAQQTVIDENITFLKVDIINEFKKIEDTIQKPVDLVSMVDVIEHLPPNHYETFFSNLGRVTAGDAVVVLTYPSPEYQRYLHLHNPDELQVIDETIEIGDLIQWAAHGNFKLQYFSYPDLDRKNQYVHCVLAKDLAYDEVPRISFKEQVKRYGIKAKNKLIMPILKYKYIKKPFNQ